MAIYLPRTRHYGRDRFGPFGCGPPDPYGLSPWDMMELNGRVQQHWPWFYGDSFQSSSFLNDMPAQYEQGRSPFVRGGHRGLDSGLRGKSLRDPWVWRDRLQRLRDWDRPFGENAEMASVEWSYLYWMDRFGYDPLSLFGM